MSEKDDVYVLEADLEAPPETVWRALAEPALRQAWLPEAGEVVEARPPEVLTLRCDEEGLVTFTIKPANDGGARLVIRQRRGESVPPAMRMAA